MPAFTPDPAAYALPDDGLPPAQRARLLRELAAYLADRRDHMLGYQVNQDMNAFQADIAPFLTSHVNNVGDPYQDGAFKVNTKVAEQAVLAYFARLWHGTPYDVRTGQDGRVISRNAESCWGYVLSMGSTEGNLYALWNARDYLAGKRLLDDPGDSTRQPRRYQSPLRHENPNAYRPVIFFSEDTHYSCTKAIRVLDLPTFGEIGREEYPHECPVADEWPAEVPSETPAGPPPGRDENYPSFGPGSIDVSRLEVLVEFFARRGHPIIVSLNFGSTFKGAYDDVRQACDRLLPIFARYGLTDREIQYAGGGTDRRRGFWIHVDGALGAAYIPFLARAAADPACGYEPPVPIPEFDFGLRSVLPCGRHPGRPMDMVSSLVCSGHKWIGSPWPCGVFMTKVKYQMQPPDNPEYIGSLDSTFAGSRNGHSPIVLWDHIAQNPAERQIALSTRAQDMTRYLVSKLAMLERRVGIDLYIARTPLALTVRFRAPRPDLVDKWSLSTVEMRMRPSDTHTREYAHIFVVPSTTEDRIDAFIADLHAPGAFRVDGGQEVVPVASVSVRYIVDDVDAAIEFYCRQLGFTEVMHPAPAFAMLSRGDLRLNLSAPGGGAGGGQAMPDGRLPEPGGWNRFALEVADLEGTVARLRGSGARFRNEIVTGVGGQQILVEDPSGNPVELFEPTRAEARLDGA